MPSAKHRQQLENTIASNPELVAIANWYRSADADEVLAELSAENQEICCYDADAAIGFTLYNKLADVLLDDERQAIRISDFIIKFVK
jgi:hypothetical protein